MEDIPTIVVAFAAGVLVGYLLKKIEIAVLIRKAATYYGKKRR